MIDLFNPADPYVRFLKSLVGRKVYLKPWDGNSGDMLIWQGTELLLQDIGVVTECCPGKADIILIPGGNQTMWQSNVDIWREVFRRFPGKKLVVGPCTVREGFSDWRGLLESNGTSVEAIFSRDPESHQVLSDVALNLPVKIGLSHDPALYLIDSELISRQRSCLDESYVLIAFRRDFEGMSIFRGATHRWLPGSVARFGRMIQRKRMIDRALNCHPVSEEFVVKDVANLTLPQFIEYVRFAKIVHTDRLHCMIFAAMLNKPVVAYGTCFNKLEAVYRHSMGNWPDVRFVSSG
jgi:exopolysaccharide biosynthesis predicted pyruvyltransferase EpsI